jgi:uncharacterized protein (TIGR00297 family)
VLLLLAFFVSGSVLTRVSGGEGGQRNARQVLANGGVAAAAGLMGWWVVAAGALAAATADTWATEIGSFSPRPPRLITTWASVARGVSGGITLLGTAAGTLGAAMLGMLAAALAPAPLSGVGIVVALAGTGGMIVDSVLGAALQGEFECFACGARFERARAVCHEPVRRTRGVSWLDNDGVNLAATTAGALIAAAAWVWFSPP